MSILTKLKNKIRILDEKILFNSRRKFAFSFSLSIFLNSGRYFTGDYCTQKLELKYLEKQQFNYKRWATFTLFGIWCGSVYFPMYAYIYPYLTKRFALNT